MVCAGLARSLLLYDRSLLPYDRSLLPAPETVRSVSGWHKSCICVYMCVCVCICTCVYMCVCVCICMHQIICMHSDRKGTVQKQITDDRCLCDCIKLARHIREQKKSLSNTMGETELNYASTFSRCQNSVVYTIYIHKNSLVNMSTYRLSLSRCVCVCLSLFVSFSLSVTMSDQWHCMLFVSLTPLWLHICVCQRSL